MGEFITPDVLPEDTFCRVLLIPNDPKWIGAVSGALLPMMYPSEWVSFGGLTPEETAARCRVMLYEFWASDGCGDDMNCCEDIVRLHRFDPDTGRPQVSIDGGATWTTDPADPENLIPLYPPIVSEGGSTKCDAATNASQHVNELITATGENLSTASTVFQLAMAVAETLILLWVMIVSGGTASPIVLGIATAIWGAAVGAFNLGIAAYEAYWTTDKQDAILCSLFCHIGDNGQFTEAQYQAFRADIKSTLPASAAFDIVMTAINAGGARGLSQMASYGNAALADCDSCDCDITCDTDMWSIVNYMGSDIGSILSVGSNYIIVQGGSHVEFGGLWVAMIQTPTDVDCCEFISVEWFTGDESGRNYFGVDCTLPRWPGSSTGGILSGDSVNTVFIRKDSGDNFTAKITFG